MFSQLLATTWFLVILFVVGLTVLVKGADWLVDGASDLAKRLSVSGAMDYLHPKESRIKMIIISRLK